MGGGRNILFILYIHVGQNRDCPGGLLEQVLSSITLT